MVRGSNGPSKPTSLSYPSTMGTYFGPKGAKRMVSRSTYSLPATAMGVPHVTLAHGRKHGDTTGTPTFSGAVGATGKGEAVTLGPNHIHQIQCMGC